MRLTLLFLFFLISASSIGQTSLSGVVNNYYAVTAYNPNSTTLTVTSTAGISIGDTLLLMQMKGADMDLSNTSTYGAINAYDGAGSHELVVICDIAGNDLILSEILKWSYHAGGSMQLISFPDVNSISIDGEVTAQPWNGSTGGVVVMRAQNTITLNADINVSEQGFRGGTHIESPFLCSFFFTMDDYEYDASAGHAALKGEGIATPNQDGGRGAVGNGGGGGNDHNTGGGGGGNLASGGIGGINDEPDPTLCQGDYPGEPGKALNTGVERIFFGGGGGAGHSNGPYDNAAGDGGGIVILIANEIIGNGNSIISNGGDGLQGSGDGGSGGGAGGSILLEIDNFTGSVDLVANGGNGGDGNGWWMDSLGIVTSTNPDRCFGPGGGGSGGMIWFKGGSTPAGITSSLLGGTNGIVTNTSNTGCDGATLGASSGTDGVIQYNAQVIINDKINKHCQYNPQIILGNDTTKCDDESMTLTSALSGVSYLWSTGETSSSIEIEDAGTYTVMIGIDVRFICDTIIVSQDGLTVDLGPDWEICGTETALLDAGAGGVSYTWSTGETSQSITVNRTGTYSVTVDDGVCVNSDEVSVVKCIEDLFIPNTITPNGDGENDTWIIHGIDIFEGNSVVIMNRNGATVYESTNYQSEWNGDGLPASTYFYLLDLNDGVSTFKGSITIIREQ